MTPTQADRQSVMARRLAWLLGFSLPLSGLPVGQWIPGYPDQLTLTRLVTFAALAWLAATPPKPPVPVAARRMIQALLAALAYAMLTLMWTPDARHGVHDLITVGMALATGIVLLLLVRGDRLGIASFVTGVLLAAAVQVGLALVEVRTGFHFSWQFAAAALGQHQESTVESVVGAVAWGTLTNPNDLGGFWLLSLAVFLSRSVYGLEWGKGRLVMGWTIALAGIALALTVLADARAFRLGLVILVAFHLFDRLVPPHNFLRIPAILLVGAVGLTWAVMRGTALVAGIQASAGSDGLRLQLLAHGFRIALHTGGIGMGLGGEKAMIESGEISTNLHNVVAQLAAELGLVAAAAFVGYLLALLIGWAFGTPRTRAMGREAALARATLALALLIYGATSSGVLESPLYWAFFALTAVVSGTTLDSRKSVDTNRVRAGMDGRADALPSMRGGL